MEESDSINDSYKDSGQGFGSSDMGYSVKSILRDSGYQDKIDSYAKGGGVHTMPNGEVMLNSAHYTKGGSTYAEGGLLRVLKDSGFNHHKGSPKNELKHNRGAYIATIGKDNMGEVVHLDIYTPDTKTFMGSTIFDNPKKLADYFNKNQLYAKGGKTRKKRKK